MEHGKKTRENKTPVKIPLKNLKINAMALLALLDTHSISEEQEINSNFLRRPEIAEKISEMPSSDDVISMLEQIRFTFKMKKPEDFCRKYEKLDQIIHEIESFDSNNPEEIIEVVAKALRTGIRTDNLTELLEKATKSTETHVLTLKHMQDFVVGDEEEIPSPILEILKQRESFILDFVARYPTWFAQDLGQIMEQELEDVLDQFRGIGVEVEPATKIVALVNIRDLLIAIHTCIIEKEGLKESFSIDSILKLVNRPEIKFMGEIELTNLKTSLESIQNTNHLVEITYPNYANILPSLEGYIWRVEVKVILSRLRTKPDQIYKLFRSVPGMMKYQEEMKIITKRLKQVPMENIAEIKESINKFLNLNLQLVDARRFLDKALLGNIQDETVFGLVRLCNRITLNEMKLDEQMCQSLIDFGYPNCKLVMKHLGKETAMKKIDNEGVSSVMKSIEDGGTQIHASKEESQKDDSHMMSEHVGDTDTNSDLKNQSQEDSKDGNSLSPNKNSNNDEEMIEEQVEEQDDEQEEDKKESQKMDIEQVPVEETHEQTDEDYDENRMILEKIAEEEEIDQQAIGIDHLHQEGEASSKPLASINNQPEILEQEEHIVEDIEVQDYNESNKSNKDMEEEQLAQVEEELKDPERPSTPEEPMVVAEQMREQHLHHDESVDSTINLPLTFENGLSLLQRGIKPSNFEGTQSEFNEAVISAHKIYNKLQNEKLELHEYNNFLTKLSRSRFLIPDMDALRSKETVAITFRSTVLMLDPEHLVERKESLAIEHESLGIEVVEFKRILEEVERDFQTSVDVKNAIEDRENLTLHQITHIKNRDQAARYFKNKTLTLKLYDIFIMAIIAAWKSHDHEKGEPEIDYLSLQEAYGVCSFTDNGKERYIKPENAEFIKKLYEKVRCHLKKTFYVLSLEDLQTKNPEKSFKRFVDLTGKFIEYRFKLQEIQGRACPKNEEEPGKKRQLKPSGKKSLIHRKIDYQHQHQQEYTLSKPAFIDKITNEHRRYYVNSWKHYILNNKFLTDRKELAYSIANKLEKEVYAFYLKRSAIQYENVGNSILHFFSKLVNLKYMTLKLKSKDFSFEFIRRFKNFTAVELTKHDEGYKQATELEALQKTKPTGKQEKNATNEELTQQATKLNTEKTNEEAKDMKAGRNKKSGSNTNKIPINEDLEPKVSSLIKNNFQEFKIFEGRLKVAVKTGVRPFPLVVLQTLDSQENIEKASQIPEDCVVSARLSFEIFFKFMDLNLFSSNPTAAYSLQQGWIENERAIQEMSKIINYYDCALSNQYSKDSKIFFFPMKAVPNQWLEKREFWINGTNKQLLYFIVTKISNNKQTPTIAPILTNSQNTFYKLTSKSHIMERELYEPKKFLKNLKNQSNIERTQNNDADIGKQIENELQVKPKQANKTVKSTGKQEQSHLFSNEDADNHHILPIFDNFQKLDSTLGKRNSKESENMNGMGQSKGDQKYSQQVGTALNKKQIFPPQDIPMNLTKVNKKYPKHFNQIKEVSDSLNITEAPLQTSRRNNQESTQAQMQVVNEIMGNPNAKQPKQTQQGPNKSKYPAHHQLLNFLSTTNNPQSNNLVQKHTLKHHPSKSAAMKLKESNSNENQMNSGRNPTHNYEQHSLVQGAFTRSNSTDREDSEEKDNPLEESIPLKHFSGAGGKNNLSLVMNYHQPNLGGRSMELHQTQMNRETHRSKPSNTTSSKIEQYLSQSHLHQMNTLNQGIEAKYYNSGIDIVGDSGKNIGTVEQVSALKQALRFIRPDDERLSHQVASGNGIRLIEGILPTKLDAGIHRHQYYKTIDDEEGCDYQPVSDEWIY